jgi:hypothetical protein
MIPEEIKQKIFDRAREYAYEIYPDGISVPGIAKCSQHFDAGGLFGYSLASSEIEALKKELERVKGIFEDQYKLDAGIYFTRYFKYSTGKQIEAMVNSAWNEVVKNNKL